MLEEKNVPAAAAAAFAASCCCFRKFLLLSLGWGGFQSVWVVHQISSPP